MRKEKSRSPPKRSNGRLPLILLVCLQPARTQIVKGAKALILPFTIWGIAGIYPNRQNKKSQSIYQK